MNDELEIEPLADEDLEEIAGGADGGPGHTCSSKECSMTEGGTAVPEEMLL